MSEVDRIDFEGISFIEFVKATFLQLGYIKGELLAYAYAKSLIHGVEILIRECNDIEAFRVNLEGYFDLYFSDKQ